MTPEKWRTICNDVTDAMKVHTRPFVTPLTSSSAQRVRLEGTGSYVTFKTQRLLLTCQHVRLAGGVDYRFYGSDEIFKHSGPWVEDDHPSVDAAIAAINNPRWTAKSTQAVAIPYNRFAASHQTALSAELLFFCGFAGENASYGFDVHEAVGTGYCSQEKQVAAPDPHVFEVFWEPQYASLTSGTDENALRAVKAQSSSGFSGSLIWNTRYLECAGAGQEWKPELAVVTGLLRRWDTSTKSLLAWRVEHLRVWLEGGAVTHLLAQQ